MDVGLRSEANTSTWNVAHRNLDTIQRAYNDIHDCRTTVCVLRASRMTFLNNLILQPNHLCHTTSGETALLRRYPVFILNVSSWPAAAIVIVMALNGAVRAFLIPRCTQVETHPLYNFCSGSSGSCVDCLRTRHG